ncbi:hypothetical protein EDB86DRAFT_3104920 [Lactarius hatsudake]|nr:hypothetical protein EDB86DRAFT_3104920 [Lactarius hatsudake]
MLHTSHEWREVALNHPFFWSYIDFTTLTPAGATEILARAKSVPLYLEAYIPDDLRVSTFKKEVQVHVSRICHLAIRAEPTHLQGVLKRLVSPAPTLEYLSLSGEKQWRLDGQPFVLVPVTLFDGSTPRLSRLELRYCDISWKSPLFRGLKHLKISRLSTGARPRLSFWLDALDEMPQLKTLTLHSASPTTSSFPFDVQRTLTLPSITHMDISASPGGCGLILAHLVLPALTSLYLTAFSRRRRNGGDMQRMLPYVVRHAHGPQDTRPLQSAFIEQDPCSQGPDILAWPAPDIDVEVQDLPNWSCTTLSPRVKLSIRNKELSNDITIEVLHCGDVIAQGTFPHSSGSQQGFITMLLEGTGERGSPLLPSLTELVFDQIELKNRWTLRLCDALMRRVEQGVPLEILDLRAC